MESTLGLALVVLLQASSSPRPTARTSFEGPALTFDFPGLRIGVAEYDEGPTGATVFHFQKPVLAAVDVRGGAPATINTDALRLAYDSPFVNAISFAGGSSYGLAAATGVADALKERTPDPGAWDHIATVAGAIIFDLGGRRYSAVTPDYELGRAALAAAREGVFPLGARGAGRFAMQGWYFGEPEHSGQGGAFSQSGPTKVLVFTVVNALGSVVDRQGQVVRCRLPAKDGCGSIAERLSQKRRAFASTEGGSEGSGDAGGANASRGLTADTTISLVVTNQKLPVWALQRLAVQVHNSMARAIQPFGTMDDGDTLFAVTTGEVENTALSAPDLGVLASETAWDAVLASVPRLPPAGPTEPVTPSSAALDAFVGEYELALGVRVRVRREGTGLRIDCGERGSLYLPKNETVDLRPVGESEFILGRPRADHIRFERSPGGEVSGFVINPGPWPIAAKRVR
jgi:L-aminopeptidase/D-esterase-like protein